MFQSLPLFVFMKVTAVHDSDVVDKYAEKLFAVSHNETLRACYQFRDIIRMIPNFDLVYLAEQTVVALNASLDYVNRVWTVCTWLCEQGCVYLFYFCICLGVFIVNIFVILIL